MIPIHLPEKLLLFFLFAFATQATCQEKIILYNRLKYEAEDEILKENFCNATQIYQKLQDSFFLWYVDINNALHCSLKCGNNSLTDKLVTTLLKGGREAKKLEKAFSDYNYFTSDDWHKIKLNPPEYFYDNSLRQKINQMYIKDQRDRYNDTLRLKNDFENLISFNEIIKEFGFPTEQQLGYTSSTDSLDFNQMLENMLVHMLRRFPWQTGDLLISNYLQGNISATKFTYLMGFAKSCDDIQLTCFAGPPASNALYVDDILFSCSQNEMLRINENRKLFHLDPVEDQLKKVQFRKNSTIRWTLDDGFATYNYNVNTYTFSSFKKMLEGQGLEVYKE